MSTLIENVAKVKSAHAALSASIEAKGVSVPAGTKLTGMPALVDQIGTGGAVEPTNDRAVFAHDDSTSLVIPNTLVVVDMASATNLRYCFSTCSNLTSLTLPAGFGQNATNIEYCFQYCGALKSLTLPDGFGQNTNTLYGCFDGCRALTSLTLPAGFGQNADNLYLTFYDCSQLTDINGNPNFSYSLELSYCPNLTHDSIMVVINGLQTVTEAQTLTLGETNLAKLTEADKQIATDKGWTLA